MEHGDQRRPGVGVQPHELAGPPDVLRGELGCYLVSDGSGRPYRIHIRGASFYNLQTLSTMVQGGLVADGIAIISSIDPIMGDVDR
ncbi:MAG TPA: hypothetical protein VHG90_01315 [Acidimicrobiales bacterium]|nr:hypothetical protein [Acidimicrobiales bacterium]